MSPTQSPPPSTLARLRVRIERADDAIIDLIVRRAQLARQIGTAKKRAGLPVLDPAREAQVVRRAAARAREMGMPSEDVRTLFWQIIALCRAEQVTPRVRRARAASRGAAPK